MNACSARQIVLSTISALLLAILLCSHHAYPPRYPVCQDHASRCNARHCVSTGGDGRRCYRGGGCCPGRQRLGPLDHSVPNTESRERR